MRLIALSVATTVSAVVALPAVAQPAASQHGTVSQTVNTTTITVEYDRPVLRGRSLFGELLDYDIIWTPGANRTTWIEFPKQVRFEGKDLAAGRYGLWMIPHENVPWEVILVRDWDTHHSFFPFEAETLRVEVMPEQGVQMEVLAFYFPLVGPYETTLTFHWGEATLPMRIEVNQDAGDGRFSDSRGNF